MPSDNQALLLKLSADVSSLEKQFAKAQGIVNNGSRAMEKRAKDAGTNIERFFGKTDPGKALDKIFDSTRFRILDSGVARVGVFGSALESLGPAGLVAAAGVGAVVAAFAGAREAAKFADDINDTANRLHVTTDALQEYRYAVRAAGGEEKGADDALEAFSENLGKAQAGLKKSQRAFLELGFTKEQIKGFTDADTALKAVVERIAGLSDVQKDAVIDQLGLKGIKPLIDDGVASMQRLRDEAHKVGVVMDADLVKRGGELNDQFETVAKVIDVQLKSALVDLGPIIVGLLGLMGEMAKTAAGIADAFRDIEHKTTTGLQNKLAELKSQKSSGIPTFNRNDQLLNTVPIIGPALAGGDIARRALQQKNIDRDIARVEAQLAARAKTNAAPPIKPTRTLVDTSKTGGGGRAKAGPRDDTEERIQQVNATLASSGRDLYQSMLALVVNVDDRAAIEKAIADQEAEQQTAQLDSQIAKIKADKGITKATKDELVARLEVAKTNSAEAAAAKQALIDRETANRRAQDALALQQTDIDGQTAVLQLQDQMAKTAGERRDVELRLLDLADQREKIELDSIIAAQGVSDADKAIAQKKLDQLSATRPAREAQVRDNTQGPLENYLDKLPKTAAQVNEAFQNLEANGISSLIDGLADAANGSAKLGDVFRNTLKQMAADATRILLQNALASAAGGSSGSGGFLKSLFKIGAAAVGAPSGGMNITGIDGGFIPFASGTDSAPGGLSLIGERGPEILNLKKGSQIIPNDILRGLSRQRSGNSTSTTNHWNVSVSPNGYMSSADARRTGRQIAAAASVEMARSRRVGFNG